MILLQKKSSKAKTSSMAKLEAENRRLRKVSIYLLFYVFCLIYIHVACLYDRYWKGIYHPQVFMYASLGLYVY